MFLVRLLVYSTGLIIIIISFVDTIVFAIEITSTTHELKQNKTAMIAWVLLTIICLFIFKELYQVTFWGSAIFSQDRISLTRNFFVNYLLSSDTKQSYCFNNQDYCHPHSTHQLPPSIIQKYLLWKGKKIWSPEQFHVQYNSKYIHCINTSLLLLIWNYYISIPIFDIIKFRT